MAQFFEFSIFRPWNEMIITQNRNRESIYWLNEERDSETSSLLKIYPPRGWKMSFRSTQISVTLVGLHIGLHFQKKYNLQIYFFPFRGVNAQELKKNRNMMWAKYGKRRFKGRFFLKNYIFELFVYFYFSSFNPVWIDWLTE